MTNPVIISVCVFWMWHLLVSRGFERKNAGQVCARPNRKQRALIQRAPEMEARPFTDFVAASARSAAGRVIAHFEKGPPPS